jgi:hypothetical protein
LSQLFVAAYAKVDESRIAAVMMKRMKAPFEKRNLWIFLEWQIANHNQNFVCS